MTVNSGIRLGAWKWWSVALFALIGIAIAAAGLYHKLMLHDAHVAESESLSAIAELKAGQISRWRQERVSDVAAIPADTAMARVARNFCETTNAEDRAILFSWLYALRLYADCRSTTLLDANFRPVLSSGDEEKQIGPKTVQAARQVWLSQKIWLSDMHRGTEVTAIHLDLIAPMTIPDGALTTTVATVLLRIDPYRTIYPMLQRWPTPSPSGETLLVRQEDNGILCMNELHSRPDAALNLSFPLTNTLHVAVRALAGFTNAQIDATAVDERGERVLWAARRVQDCPWFVIVKKDLREIDASVQRESLLVVSTVTGLVLAILVVIAALWRRDHYHAVMERMASRQNFDLWLRFANDIILLMDQDGQVVEANERAVQSYGYTRAELLRLNVLDLLASNADTNWRKHNLVYATFHRRKDDQLFPVEVSAHRMEIQGRVFYQHIVRDITENRRLEAQLRQSQKFDAIGRLAGGVAHDFNNILTVIFGYTDLLLDAPIHDATARPQIEEIRHSSERAATLTQQLLALSSRQPATMQALVLNQIVSEMSRLLCRVIGEHIHLDTVLQPDLASVRADPGQIEQVLLNLTINARDAMPAGGLVRIRTANVTLDTEHVRLHQQSQTGDHVLLEVSDTGGGMTAELLSHIFEPFFTTKEQGKGTGLGLATVYGIVRQSGGHITVESEVGRGSTFRVYLPRYTGETTTATQKNKEPSAAIPGHETILVVEDELAIRQLAVNCLRNAGYNVIEAADGKAALRVAGKTSDVRIDLLFADIVMPKIDGQTLAKHLRKLRPDLRIIYTTGYIREMPDRDAAERDKFLVLPKPYTPAQLRAKVRALLDQI